jgi:hypothetical protein
MTTLQEIDAELARLPATDIDSRAALMVQRCELYQAEKAAAVVSKPAPRGNLVINVPKKLGISHFSSNAGRVVQARVEGGRTVLDLFAPEFTTLLAGPWGLLWEQANPEAMLARGNN